MSQLEICSGDIFASPARVIANPVNTVGVMGKGLALAFKRRYPEMFRDYAFRCRTGQLRIGEPYLWEGDSEDGRAILVFPTKRHWREPSRLEDVLAGLDHLVAHAEEWQLESLALPALGCGLGGLDFEQALPEFKPRLEALARPVWLYRPA